MTKPFVVTPEMVQLILREDFVAFIEKVFDTVSPGSPYLRNWHIEAMAYRLEEVRVGRIKRLIITLPPRSLKSVIASVAFPAFLLGHQPSEKIVAVSYGAELAVKHANDFRAVMNAAWYRRAFPQTRIDTRKDNEREIRTTGRGYRLTTSIDGPLTGRGGNIFVIDDPLKAQDAYSEPKRRAVNDWFRGTLLSRADDPDRAAFVIVTQRLHAEDLVGHVTELSQGWHILNLPAIAQEDELIPIGPRRQHQRHKGEALHPERQSIAQLGELQREIGSAAFAAQYLQSPVPPDGAIIKRAWLKRYSELPSRPRSTQVVLSWDTGMKPGDDTDYSVCTTWYIDRSTGWKRPNLYLADVFRERLDYPSLKQQAKRLMDQHRAPTVLIEDAGLGTGLVQDLRREGRRVIPIRPVTDKITRLAIAAAKIEEGQLFLPNSAAWLTVFETELLAFPHGRHDDQVDSLSQVFSWLNSHYTGPLQGSYSAT